MSNSLKYGDKITIKMTPGLEQEIAQILEDWVIHLSNQEDIDLMQEQFVTMKQIIRKLAELGEVH
jgi:hypothetical protein